MLDMYQELDADLITDPSIEPPPPPTTKIQSKEGKGDDGFYIYTADDEK